MMENVTLNCNEPLLDEMLTAEIRKVFASEKKRPNKSVLDFIFGYAASYESIGSEMLGMMDVMKN